MTNKSAAEVIQVPNMLKLKVGGRGGIDMAAIAKAEAALKSLSGNFAQWLDDEIVKLEAARQEVRAQGLTPETVETLYLRAHGRGRPALRHARRTSRILLGRGRGGRDDDGPGHVRHKQFQSVDRIWSCSDSHLDRRYDFGLRSQSTSQKTDAQALS